MTPKNTEFIWPAAEPKGEKRRQGRPKDTFAHPNRKYKIKSDLTPKKGPNAQNFGRFLQNKSELKNRENVI